MPELEAVQEEEEREINAVKRRAERSLGTAEHHASHGRGPRLRAKGRTHWEKEKINVSSHFFDRREKSPFAVTCRKTLGLASAIQRKEKRPVGDHGKIPRRLQRRPDGERRPPRGLPFDEEEKATAAVHAKGKGEDAWEKKKVGKEISNSLAAKGAAAIA